MHAGHMTCDGMVQPINNNKGFCLHWLAVSNSNHQQPIIFFEVCMSVVCTHYYVEPTYIAQQTHSQQDLHILRITPNCSTLNHSRPTYKSKQKVTLFLNTYCNQYSQVILIYSYVGQVFILEQTDMVQNDMVQTDTVYSMQCVC